MKTLEELTPGGCRWPVADLCTAGDRPGSKTRFCGEPVEERLVGTQLCPYCAQPMPPWPTFASGISQLMTVPKPIEK